MPETPDGWALSAPKYIEYLERVALMALAGRSDHEQLIDLQTGDRYALLNIRQQIACNRKYREGKPDG